jgi:2,5-dichloro-2,5-cyclohexadiene-1,4-diol dehydrogenase 1
MSDLSQKSIIVTGGGSGIGAAAALRLAESGARVTVADLNEQGGRDVVDKIRSSDGEAQFLRTDISSEADVRAMVDAAVQAYGKLDGAFNNAGVPAHSHQGKGKELTFLADMPVEIFRRGVEINVIGTFLCMKYEIAAMKETGGGSIVNTSSGAGILAIAGAADYIAAKHAVIGLTKSAALDYATVPIRVNALIPGVIRTPMMEASFEEHPHLYDWAAEMQPNKRLGKPVEVAEAAVWLLSDAASLVTGISMPVDGGYTMV